MKIKEIFDNYNVQVGDIIYVKDYDSYYMLSFYDGGQEQFACVVNLQTGSVGKDTWVGNAKDFFVEIFSRHDCELVGKHTIERRIARKEDKDNDED